MNGKQFESWEEFIIWGKKQYEQIQDDKEWLEYVYNYAAENDPQFAEELCLGTPGIMCINEDDDMDCIDCLLRDIAEVKRWFEIKN